MAPWYKTGVFYELYPRAFYDSNGDGYGDFKGLMQKVDHLKELGVDCVWITPFYPSPLFDDGYDISDFYSVHPMFGTLEDFKAAVDALHANGIRVIADMVMNHTSDQHPWFQESRSSLDNPKRDWYVWSDSNTLYQDARIIFIDTEDSNWAYDEQTGQYYWHRFYTQQPDLNFDNPEVQEEMLKIVDFWLEFGLDGFRADAVPYLYERENTNCENLEETHQFLKRLRSHVDQRWGGEKILLCEANQWPDEVRPYFGDGDEFQMGFHFPVMPRLYMAVRRGSRSAIVDIMNATPPIPPDCQWCVFLRNHDELTLEMVTPEERDYMWDEYAPDLRMRLNLGIRRRLAPLMDNDQRKIELLNSMLFTLPGTPIIYYGDEIGMGDNIHLRDRNGVRTPMQWDDSPQGGFTSAETSYEPVIEDPVFGYQCVNVASQRQNPHSLYNTIRHMIQVRRQHPVFGLGTFEFLLPENEAVLAYWRVLPGSSPHAPEAERILVLHNLTGIPQQVTFLLPEYLGVTPIDLLRREEGQQTGAFWQISDMFYSPTLQPYAYHWLKFEQPQALGQ